MKVEKIAGALGLCRRAGKITVGAYLVKEELLRGRAALVLLACDAGRDTERQVVYPAEKGSVPVKRIGLTKKELAECVGKRGVAACVSVPKEFIDLVLASL